MSPATHASVGRSLELPPGQSTTLHAHGRPRGLVAYVVVIVGAGLTMMLATLPGFPWHRWIDLGLFVALATLSDCWTVRTTAANMEGEVSPAFTVIYAAAVVFGPAFGALTASISLLFTEGGVRQKGVLKACFNASQVAVAAASTGLVFEALRTADRLSLTGDAIGFGAAALVFLFVNVSLPIAWMALSGLPFVHEALLVLRQEGLFYVAMVPLGALLAYSYQLSRWTILYFPLLMIVIQKGLQLIARLQMETNNALVVLADTVDKRDPHTYQHSVRVANYVAAIAERLRLPASETELVISAARVHDLGKLSTDNRILFKAGPLTDEERAQIRAHPADGADLAGQFSMYGKGRDCIRHHHERWDGHGYPDGLAGEAIPLGARIIAVADSFDAMTSDRPYRSALPREVAIDELRRCSGTQFDRQVVEAFLTPETKPALARTPQRNRPVHVHS